MQDEALWQSLAAGEPHPRVCQWVLTTPARAAHLLGSATSYLGDIGPVGKVYVVVLHGQFRPPGQRAHSALYLVVTRDHYYLAYGYATANIALARLGAVHSFAPRLPVAGGVWGHTLFAGGPAPGGPRALPFARVLVWRGVSGQGAPLTQLRSNGDGFFALDLGPGVYTLKLGLTNGGGPTPLAVRVVAGRPVAAGLVEDVP